jgi:hypothetical protein
MDNKRIQRPVPAKAPRLGFALVLPMLLFIGGLASGAWWLSESLVLRQTVSEGRTVADMVENIGRWASQYGGVHVRTVGSMADVISASGSKARYRLTARTVLNKNNAPDAFESEALDAVQAAANAKADAPGAQEYWRISGNRLLYARSVVAQASCLRCHDKPDSAPEFIRTNAQFNGGGGYGYVAGKPAGLISVSVPLTTNANFVQNLPHEVWAAVGLALIGALWMLVLAFRRLR